jgi:hypothetical protein
MKSVMILFFMVVMMAMSPFQSATSAEVDCVDCINPKLLDESPIEDVRGNARSLSSIIEKAPEQLKSFNDPGIEHPAAQASRPNGRAPSIIAEETESFVIQ